MSLVSIDSLATGHPGRAPATRPMLLDHTPDELVGLVQSEGEPAYRGRQLFAALHQRGVDQWDQLRELPLRLRARLGERYGPLASSLVFEARSSDGTRKRLLRLTD